MGIISKIFGPQLTADDKDKLNEYKIEAEQEAKMDAAQAKIDKAIQDEIEEKERKEAKIEAERAKIKKRAVEDSKPLLDKVKSYVVNKIEEGKAKRLEKASTPKPSEISEEAEDVANEEPKAAENKIGEDTESEEIKEPKTLEKKIEVAVENPIRKSIIGGFTAVKEGYSKAVKAVQSENVRRPFNFQERLAQFDTNAANLNKFGNALVGAKKRVNYVEPNPFGYNKSPNKRVNYVEPNPFRYNKTPSKRVNYVEPNPFRYNKTPSKKIIFSEPNMFGYQKLANNSNSKRINFAEPNMFGFKKKKNKRK